VGCRNNGNTCYLNSVLQFLFTIKPLRDLVLNFDAYVQDPSPEALKGKKVGRTVVTPKRVATAQNFVRELQSLFQWMIHAPTDNVLPTQYLAILALCKTDSPETEAKTPETEAEVKENIEPINKPVPDPTKTDSPATISADSEMDAEDTKNDDAQSESSTQAVDGNIDASGHPSPPTRPPPIPPRPQAQPQTKAPEKTTEDHIRESARQQDAAEVMGNILDLISCAIKGDGVLQDGEQDDLIKNLFFSNVTIVRNTKDKAEKTSEPRNHHLISAGGRDRHLYAALDDDFGLSELEGGDSKYEYIGTAAPIQIINVRRLQFNKEKKQQVRDTAQLSLDDVLYLDRYLEETQTLSGDKLLQLRKAQWAKQQELQRLAVRCKELQASEVEGMDLSNAVEETAMFTESFFAGIEQRMFDPLPTPPPEELPGSLHERARQLQAELEDISASMTTLESDIDTVFKQYHDHGYRLHAIFVHRGGTGSGHYLIYIKDFQNDMWREYNDETVKAYTTEDIFKLGSGALAAGSTGIVFVKESAINTLTEAVCRQPDTAAVAGTAATLDHRDTEMMDLDAPKMELGNLEVIEGVEKS
jgi:ubiquitin carboxyl-terminal hydrolase 25/28